MLSIPTHVREMIGQEFDQRHAVVSRLEFQRWAAAVGDLNPLYFDPDFAIAHGYRDVVMPPLFISYAISGVKRLDNLRNDGSPLTNGGVDLPIPHRRRMAAGNRLETIRPVYGGDELTSVTRLVGVSNKSGRSGSFVLVEWDTRYSDPTGSVVSELTSGVILA